MSRRGDIVQLRHRIGFGPKGKPEAVVLVQAGPLIAALPTVLVVPLDSAVASFAGDPSCVPVSAREAGGTEHVAVVTQLRPVRVDALEPAAHGHLGRGTMKALERALKLVLGL